MCGKCRGRIDDVFYIVADAFDNIKLGITSGDPRPRLTDHMRDGYYQRLFLAVGLPDGVARATETKIMQALYYDHDIDAIRGYEYFPPEAADIAVNMAMDLLRDHQGAD